jgi:hypothetical protein
MQRSFFGGLIDRKVMNLNQLSGYFLSDLLRFSESRVDHIQLLIRKYKNRREGRVALQLIYAVLRDIFGLLLGGLGDDLRIVSPDGVEVDVACVSERLPLSSPM